MAQQEAMNLMEFMERYDIEEKCREYLYGLRWDEFCFRFNRRRRVDQLFARTLIACPVAKPFPRYALV
ncbi:MAG: hypothetical protein LBS18_06095 [Clostridiales bacterium]|nr:hypothetical protein [Clostridiales bacterium]